MPITITSLTSEGEGIGSLQGFKVFIEQALPGETVDFTMVETRKNFGKGRLDKIVTPSLHRVSPLCPHFKECGGCQIMHLSYEEQLNVKRERIIHAMHRLAHLKDIEVKPCIPSPDPIRYRNKIQLPNIDGKIGLFKRNSHEIVPIKNCYIQCSQGELILDEARKYLHPSFRYLCIKNGINTKESLIILVTDGTSPQAVNHFVENISPLVVGIVENINRRDDNVIFTPHFKTLFGRPFIYEKLLNKTFKVSASSFFQVNTKQAEQLISYCLEISDLQSEHRLFDAFCGVGVFSLFAAEKCHFVKGVEISSQAISDAKENSVLNNISNLSFHCGKAEEASFTNFDTIFLNPPRKGCDQKLLASLGSNKPKKIIYVSCDPATLARDLAILHSFGYQILHLQPFDMFPQTMHVETVAHLSLA